MYPEIDGIPFHETWPLPHKSARLREKRPGKTEVHGLELVHLVFKEIA